MPDMVIVTIEYNGEGHDFELPTKLPYSFWEQSLADLIQFCYETPPSFGRKHLLRWKDIVLGRNDTLEQYGIYDGSKLQLEGV